MLKNHENYEEIIISARHDRSQLLMKWVKIPPNSMRMKPSKSTENFLSENEVPTLKKPTFGGLLMKWVKIPPNSIRTKPSKSTENFLSENGGPKLKKPEISQFEL